MATRRVQCMQCLAVNEIPDGVDPHTLTWCQCCTLDHHHGEAAAACPGNEGAGHAGQPCTFPNPRACTVLTAPGDDCPGGHCGIGVEGCAVCRPVIHFGQPGDIVLAGGI
jgi:hypothetical protein